MLNISLNNFIVNYMKGFPRSLEIFSLPKMEPLVVLQLLIDMIFSIFMSVWLYFGLSDLQ